MTLTVRLEGFENGAAIPARFATCTADGAGGVKPGGNLSPAIQWEGAPFDTQSFALIVVDRDVPADFGPANKPGQTIAADAPRQSFYHWLVVDIPPVIARIEPGAPAPGQVGRNSFGARAAGHNGYDGPCPPFNDERLHTYRFMVYALNVTSLDLDEGFTGEEAEKALAGYVLAEGEATGVYTTNPERVG
ncbi:YbhB/YbcL family Raf kinase inhibitor-like protein [Asticcacaulis sp. EMRT-3]|uniref:YbhB/YbcL family Raf kinase inhibitor-like protein n=1 Tax=Asticcacaulis sp. EMRT-3 TaxID=3040349 RepID=UPI0024AE89EA|nr:YbhB/YbcL family Raf kinase inhibitor-like protein [Asticcacaulis sp. EMRT-3]MDI7775341.1 YbhB/YbcL family Raf kinase inhibitor-like protein [Asticcacaulis sp. EMRT-3]